MKTLTLLAWFAVFASAAKVVNFDTATIGKLPPGWTATVVNGTPSRWEIRKDTSAPTQPYVLAQVSEESGADRNPLAVLDEVSLRDGDVSVRVKPVSGREERAGGVVWRYRDPRNYYLVRANALTGDVVVYKVENGRMVPIHSPVTHNIPSNGWSILKISIRGPRIQVYVNHRRILEVRDATFSAAGKVGLWTGADSVTYFDDFRVNPK